MNKLDRRISWMLVTTAFALVTSAQCGPVTTGGARTQIRATLEGLRPSTPSSVGWTVSFEQALLSVDTIRWFTGNPVFDARVRPRTPLLISWGTAWAHPGHYTPGEALADTAPMRVFDLLSAPVSLGSFAAVTGMANSASLALRPADASRAAGTALSAGSTLRVQGAATRDGVTVRFRAELTDSIDIEGTPAHGAILADGSTRSRVVVDLGLWLDRADFSTLASVAASADGVIDVPASAQVRNALFRGASNGAAYRVTVTSETGP